MIKRIIIVITALAAWFALILQLYILVNNTPANGMTPVQAIGRFLVFFTVLTNLLVAISLTIILFMPGSSAGRFFIKPAVISAIAMYILIVGLVYNIILRSLWQPAGLQKLADELLHVVVPLLFILYWIIYAPKSSLKWSHAFKWLSFPAAYLIYAMVRGSVEGFYPYPFIDANKLTAGQIFVNCAGLLLVFVIAGLVFIWIARSITARQK